MVILVTLVALGLVFALVTWRRRTTARWRPDRARRIGAAGTPWCTKVWAQREQPRRSLRSGDRVTGELCVDADAGAATFRVVDGQHVAFTNVRSVRLSATRSDFVNTWVEVDCDVNGARTPVYLNDARWLGWRPLLTGANTRLADALASLMTT